MLRKESVVVDKTDTMSAALLSPESEVCTLLVSQESSTVKIDLQ